MKNQILDDIFHNKLPVELKEDEVIQWDGKPYVSQWSKFKTILFVGFTPLIYLLIFIEDPEDKWFYLIFAPLLIFAFFSVFRKQKKTRYLITNQRIIFQLPGGRKTKTHSLPLDWIKEIEISKEGDNQGTLLLSLAEGKKSSFKTINLKTDQPRKKISLEMVEDPDEVFSIIEANQNES